MSPACSLNAKNNLLERIKNILKNNKCRKIRLFGPQFRK